MNMNKIEALSHKFSVPLDEIEIDTGLLGERWLYAYRMG